MALGDDYITSAQLKTRLGLTDAQDDTRIAGAVSTASRDVEQYCHRQFNNAGAVSAREFSTRRKDVVLTDDFHTTTGLVIAVVELDAEGNETVTTLTAGQYRLEPTGGRVNETTGWPYWLIRNHGIKAFLAEPNFVRVTANWGWAEVPDAVVEATLILAEEYFKMKEAPFGVANWGEFGPVRVRHNPFARKLLDQYAKGRVMVA